MRTLVYVVLLVCLLPSVLASAELPDSTFEKFRVELDQAISKVNGDLANSAYHFVFAVCTAGDYAGQMSAVREIVRKSLDSGLLRNGDKVSFVSFELTTWSDYWRSEPFTLENGAAGVKELKVESMPVSSWTDIERGRQNRGGRGGHDVDAMLDTVLNRLTKDGDGRSTVIVVFQGSNLLYQAPAYSTGPGKAKTESPAWELRPYRHYFPQRYAHLIGLAGQMRFKLSSEGVQSTHYIPLSTPDPKSSHGEATLHVWVYAPTDIRPLARIAPPRGKEGAVLVRVKDKDTGRLIQEASLTVDGGLTSVSANKRVLLSPGVHTLAVIAPGYADPDPLTVTVAPFSSREVMLLLQPVHLATSWGLLATLAVLLLLLVRWRVRPANESRILLFPLIWLSPMHISSQVVGKPQKGDFVLSEENCQGLDPGRLIRVSCFLLPWIGGTARGSRSTPVLGKRSIALPLSDGEQKRIEFSSSLALGIRWGICKSGPRIQRQKKAAPRRR